MRAWQKVVNDLSDARQRFIRDRKDSRLLNLAAG